MTKVENKLISARNELYKTKTRAPRASLWMEFFMSKASKIEHEAFISAWLSIFVFPHKSLLIKSSLFPIAVHLARGKPIALAPSVLACLYKDLRLFKETIVGLTKTTTEGAKFPLKVEVNVQSPIYLVKVWLWERFKNLQLSREWIKMFQLVCLDSMRMKPLLGKITADPYLMQVYSFHLDDIDAGVYCRPLSDAGLLQTLILMPVLPHVMQHGGREVQVHQHVQLMLRFHLSFFILNLLLLESLVTIVQKLREMILLMVMLKMA
ncbi:uncharacterized protein [Medicago truncatula]|uniref:uncharacterized protein n=1 Tax=Medicago truncatula TaxID=3880 RepID=UPI001966E1D7|nr:uncharacterized protein LOC112417492 [Medicago truncatula]